MVVASGNFFYVTIWGSCSLLNAADLATFGVLTQIDMSSHVVSHLASRAYRRWIPSELNESDRGTRTTAEQNIRLVAHLLDDQHSEPYGEREQLLRPSSTCLSRQGLFARLLVIALVSLMRNPRAEGSAQEVVGDEEDAVARGPLTNSRRVAVLMAYRFFSFCQDTVKTHFVAPSLRPRC